MTSPLLVGQELPSATLRTERTAGNIPFTNTAGGWVDLDPGGSAASRPLDLVFTRCRPGQTIEIEPLILTTVGATAGFLSPVTIKAGAIVSRIGDSVVGIGAWALFPNTNGKASGAYPYTLVAEDIDTGGIVRVRMQYKADGTARTFYATTGAGFGYPLILVGRGPFGVGA